MHRSGWFYRIAVHICIQKEISCKYDVLIMRQLYSNLINNYIVEIDICTSENYFSLMFIFVTIISIPKPAPKRKKGKPPPLHQAVCTLWRAYRDWRIKHTGPWDGRATQADCWVFPQCWVEWANPRFWRKERDSCSPPLRMFQRTSSSFHLDCLGR